MARDHAPPDINKMFSLRIGGISPIIKTEDLLADFSVFGEVGDFYRPTNMDKLLPCPFAFIRYQKKESADAAMEHFHGKLYGDNKLTIHDANLQDSFFTQDTGFITNEMFDTPLFAPPEFDSSLPSEHYEELRKRQYAEKDEQWCIRINDIPERVQKEEIEELCKPYGVVCSIYYPINLRNLKPRGFCLVRYSRLEEAERAIKHLSKVVLDHESRRPLEVRYNEQKEYISQNENPKVVTGLDYNKYADFLPSFRDSL